MFISCGSPTGSLPASAKKHYEGSMAKGLGIAAIVLLLISFPIPIIGTWIGYLALVLAALAAVFGSKTLPIATTVLAAIKMYFLSPGLMATMYIPFAKVDGQSAPLAAYAALILTTALVALPIVALIFRPALAGLVKAAGISPPAS
jgi:hypothetical protein